MIIKLICIIVHAQLRFPLEKSMPQLVLWGAIFFTLALIFYSIGIWSDFIGRQLKRWHLIMFGLGVVTDSLGTLLMYLHVGYLIFTAHSIAGFLGLFLMILHFSWAYFVLGNNNRQVVFHRFSILVWAFWMVSYISGLYLGLQH